jgi:hypothetical protein
MRFHEPSGRDHARELGADSAGYDVSRSPGGLLLIDIAAISLRQVRIP